MTGDASIVMRRDTSGKIVPDEERFQVQRQLRHKPNLLKIPRQQTHDERRDNDGNQPGVGQAKVGSSQDAQRQGLYVEGKVNGHAVTFLVDTGSSHTLISESVYRQNNRIKEASSATDSNR